MELDELGEFGLIERISARFPQPAPPELGIGDDAALLTPQVGMQLVVSTDLLAEGVHFELSFGQLRLLGRKALAVNISDLAAMGAIPRWFFLSLGIPSGLRLSGIDSLLDGLAEQAVQHGLILAGGDTCGSKSGLVISVTIMGEQRPELLIRRAGARPGDDVWVSGTLGDSALGLRILQQGKGFVSDKATEYVINRHLDPSPRVVLGQTLAEAGLATSMIDISDGLMADLGHICRQSCCGAEIDLALLPLSRQFRLLAGPSGSFPWHLPLAGGEDYELCFTSHPSCRDSILEISKNAGIDMTVIGTISNSGEVVARLPDGAAYLPDSAGFNHFYNH